MFSSQQNPAIAQVRRELRGQLPDTWLDEVLYVFEYGGESLDELRMEDLLKLKVAAVYSATLKRLLDQASKQQSSAIVSQPPTNFFGLRW